MTENRTLGETSIKSMRQKRRNDSHSQATTNTQKAVNMMSLGKFINEHALLSATEWEGLWARERALDCDEAGGEKKL